MEVIKWIFVVAALAGMALALVELVTEKPDAATDSDRLRALGEDDLADRLAYEE